MLPASPHLHALNYTYVFISSPALRFGRISIFKRKEIIVPLLKSLTSPRSPCIALSFGNFYDTNVIPYLMSCISKSCHTCSMVARFQVLSTFIRPCQVQGRRGKSGDIFGWCAPRSLGHTNPRQLWSNYHVTITKNN